MEMTHLIPDRERDENLSLRGSGTDKADNKLWVKSRLIVLVSLTLAFTASLLFVADPVVAQEAVTGEGQVLGSPDIEVSVTDNRLETGEVQELTVTLSNSGDIRRGGPQVFQERVKMARNVRVSLEEEAIDAPIDVKTGTVVLGDVADGRPRTATFRVETSEDVKVGRYRIPVQIEYTSTRLVEYFKIPTPPGYTNPRYRGEREKTIVEEVEVVFESEPRFDVVSDTASGLYAGDTGIFKLKIRNTGDKAANDTTVLLESGSEGVAFGPLENPRKSASVSVSKPDSGDPSVTEYNLAPRGSGSDPGSEITPTRPESSDLAPGESETVSVKMNAGDEVTPGIYPVSVRVEYFNENGVEDTSERIQTQVRVGRERRFKIEDLRTESLRVDENDGVVRGKIVNTGTATARNVVVTLSSKGTITATGPEAAVKDLKSGESKSVRFDLAVAEDAEPGNRSLTFNVEYENDDGDIRKLDDPVRKTVTVGEEVDEFEILHVNTSVNAGGSSTVKVEIRNTGGYTTEDANAKMFVNDPLSSSDNSAFLGDMEPNETETAVFKITATGEAIPKEYDASLEVRYDDRTGDMELTDGMSFGIPVGESSGGIPLPFIVAGVIVTMASGAVFVYQRERNA
jgi:hypothetical protein